MLAPSCREVEREGMEREEEGRGWREGGGEGGGWEGMEREEEGRGWRGRRMGGDGEGGGGKGVEREEEGRGWRGGGGEEMERE